MGTLIGIILVFLGWVGLVSATCLWGGYGIYELIKSDEGFFAIILPCVGYWILQMVLSWIALIFGAAVTNS